MKYFNFFNYEVMFMKKLSLLFLLMVSNVAIGEEMETSRFNRLTSDDRLTSDEKDYIRTKPLDFYEVFDIDFWKGRDAAIKFLKRKGYVLPTPSELYDIRLQNEMRWQADTDKRLQDYERLKDYERLQKSFMRLQDNEIEYIKKHFPNFDAALNIDSKEGRDAAIKFLKENGFVLPTPSELSDMRLQKEAEIAAKKVAYEEEIKRNFIRRFRAITGSTRQGPLKEGELNFKKLTEENVFYEYSRYIKHFPPAGEDEEIVLIKKIIAEFEKEDKKFLENLTKVLQPEVVQKAYLENS